MRSRLRLVLSVVSLCAGVVTFAHPQDAFSARDLQGLEVVKIKPSKAWSGSRLYDNLYVAYKRGDLVFTTPWGEQGFNVRYYYIYFMRGTETQVLARVEPGRVIDPFGKVVFELGKLTIETFGLSYDALRTPLAPSLVATSRNPVQKYRTTESFVLLNIDAAAETVTVWRHF